jgi:membrane glycosyltransferase
MALVWAVLAFEVNQTLFLWLSVIVVPLFFAVPISVFLSYPEAGLFFKKSGIFLTPVETHPSTEILRFNDLSP